MSLASPYRFIPTSEVVLLPDWAEQVSHDVPFEDGFCGEINYTITNKTVMCIGGERITTPNKPQRVKFYRTPEGKIAIPGTSLKGVIREVLKIATFGKFQQVADNRFGVRDLKQAFYKNTVVKDVRAGYLFFEQGQWSVQPCQYVRVKIERLVASGLELQNTGKIAARYEKVKGSNQFLNFNIGPETTKSRDGRPLPRGTATDLGRGALSGRIVLTGGKSGKKNEFLFYQPTEERLCLATKVFADFQFIYQSHEIWQYWRNPKRISQGIPVFYHLDKQGDIKTMGLSLMYKIAYEHSVGELLKRNRPAHTSVKPDMSDLILGYLDESENSGANNVRGRVNFSHALVQGDAKFDDKKDLILGEPKATFYPAYLQQTSNQLNSYMNDDALPAGWKRYPVKAESISRVQMGGRQEVSDKVKSTLEVVQPETQFSGKITFHNLRASELGALLWALDFGGRDKCKHGLGMGKPFGFGQAELTINALTARANAGQQDNIATHCKNVFNDYMNQQLAQFGGLQDWQDLPQVKLLIAMADPDYAAQQLLDYPPTIQYFQNAKSQPMRFAPYIGKQDIE